VRRRKTGSRRVRFSKRPAEELPAAVWADEMERFSGALRAEGAFVGTNEGFAGIVRKRRGAALAFGTHFKSHILRCRDDGDFGADGIGDETLLVGFVMELFGLGGGRNISVAINDLRAEGDFADPKSAGRVFGH
jgi:hypothetical protein